MAVMAIFVFTVMVISVAPVAIAQNMTGGNMTEQISNTPAEIDAQCSISPACIT